MNKKIINNILYYAIERGVDSIVIESSKNKILIHYYSAGESSHSFTLPKKLETDLMADLHWMLKVKTNELVRKRYSRIHNKYFNLTFYLSITPNKFGEKIVINIIKRERHLWQIKQLGLQRRQLKLLNKILKTRSGLIIISSPPGGGKSTTLYSLLQDLNKPELDIYLLEDNPEHKIAGINEISPRATNWSLLLRHDSDIIVLDDGDDDETLMRAIQTAASGRLVIISMLANSSWEILLRILRLKIPLDLKLNSLKLIINQRVARLQRANANSKNGRKKIGLFEILEFNHEMKEFILATRNDPQKKQFWEKLARLAIKNGFSPLSEDIKNKLDNKLLDPENYL